MAHDSIFPARFLSARGSGCHWLRARARRRSVVYSRVTQAGTLTSPGFGGAGTNLDLPSLDTDSFPAVRGVLLHFTFHSGDIYEVNYLG